MGTSCQCPLDDYHPYNIPLDCPKTWSLLQEGHVLGVFQLESKVAQQLLRKLKPENIEQLSALLAINRPGCLEATFDGKSITNHYIDRKNGNEEAVPIHPALKDILHDTYHVLIYQEQALQIAHKLAGFSLAKADELRKAIGKKKASLMHELEADFIDGCQKVGLIDKGAAELIFGWMKKSQRYLFNKSHSILYAINTYSSAYAKAHFPLQFYTETLSLAKYHIYKYERISQLIDEAKLFNINVCLPSLKFDFERFTVFDDCIYFGLGNIKGVGGKSVPDILRCKFELQQAFQCPIEQCGWTNILFHFCQKLSKDLVVALIEAGALDFVGLSRNRMLFEYHNLQKLTQKEIDKILNSFPNLEEHLTYYLDWLLDRVSAKRKEAINAIILLYKKPPYSLEDSLSWINRVEQARLGHSISDLAVSNIGVDIANTTCIDFLKKNYNPNEVVRIAGQIIKVRAHRTKNGNRMCFMSIKDNTGQVDCIIFENLWERLMFQNIILEGNQIIASGKASLYDQSSLVVTDVLQL